MNEINEILADVKQEGSDPFENLVEEPTESLPVETKEVVEAPVVEENIPFHKHPRWIERENELAELREREEGMANRIAELETPKVATDIPDWFTELYGDNQVAYQKYSEHEQKRFEEMETRILARQQEAQTQAQKEGDKWSNWVDSELSRLEGEGHTFDQNLLRQTMLDYSPTDENNNLSFDKGLKIYQALHPKGNTAKSDARKQLADTTTNATTKGEPAQKDYLTPADLRGRSMMSL